MCLAFSYKERLKAMVLREEFFPLMEEVKNSVAVMIKGANGNILHKCTKTPNNLNFDLFNTTQLSFMSRFLSPCLVFSAPRAVGLWWPPLSHSASIKSRKLHERCKNYIFKKLNECIMSDAVRLPFVPVLYCTDQIIKMYLLRVVTVQMPLASGWPHCSSWQTPKPTNLAWTSCTMLPRWDEAWDGHMLTEENICCITKNCYHTR